MGPLRNLIDLSRHYFFCRATAIHLFDDRLIKLFIITNPMAFVYRAERRFSLTQDGENAPGSRDSPEVGPGLYIGPKEYKKNPGYS
jgi:hypothetical protein